MNPDKLLDVILFTCEKWLKQNSIEFLKLIEDRDNYIKSLENTLIKMGVGNYEESKVDFQRDRANVLSGMNNGLRDLQKLKDLIK